MQKVKWRPFLIWYLRLARNWSDPFRLTKKEKNRKEIALKLRGENPYESLDRLKREVYSFDKKQGVDNDNQ